MATAILTSVISLVFLFTGYWLGYSNHAGVNPIEIIKEHLPDKPDEPLSIDEEEEYRIEVERKGGDIDW